MLINTPSFHPLESLKEFESTQPWYHFSVDDVFQSLIEVTDKNISLFEHPHFSLLREMHNLYGVRVGLNLFFQKEIDGRIRSLREVRDLRGELKDSGDWIFFGPHALDFDNAPHQQTQDQQITTFDSIYKEIDRFAGNNRYAKWVRLHFYSESYELADYFKLKGVEALFSTDRPVYSHRMPDEIKSDLQIIGSATYREANFIRTQFRVEFFVDQNLKQEEIEVLFEKTVSQFGYIIIYTHEYEFDRKEIHDMICTVFAALEKLSIKSVRRI